MMVRSGTHLVRTRATGIATPLFPNSASSGRTRTFMTTTAKASSRLAIPTTMTAFRRMFTRPQRGQQYRFFANVHQQSASSSSSSKTSFFTWYSKKLDTHPVTTKCISAGLISSIGNVLAQTITFQQEIQDKEQKQLEDPDADHTPKTWQDFQVDFGQVGRFAFLNVIFVAPVLHHWYNFINRALPGKSIARVLQRTFWDEFVFSPIYIPIFLAGLWKLEGTDWPKIKNMMVKEVPGIIVAEWTLWVPTMIITFRYAPVKFQVLVINVVGVVWQTFLSFMAAHAHAAETPVEETPETKASLYLETVVGETAAHQGCETDHHHHSHENKVKATSAVEPASSS